MKRKILMIITFVISFSFFCNDVSADYKATVLNPVGAKCSLRDTSTGYCFYKDKNLDSYLPVVVWLDTGDEVTVIESKDRIESPDKNLCSDYYVYAGYYFSKYSSTYYGYYCNANLKSDSLLTDELKVEFTNAGFPESYFEKLAIMKTAHPNWTFKALKTGIKFSDAVSGENTGARSLVQGVSSNNYAYLALDYGAFDYINDEYVAYDSRLASVNYRWYRANYDTIAYYMDPRNFLNDMYIFQFESLSYDDSISDENLKNIIDNAFTNNYLLKFSSIFIEAGKQSKVNPIYLAALSKQEVGATSATTAVSGTYNGHYNFYNIGATGGDTPAITGLNYAAGTDEAYLRPWNTEYKAIVGGALWIGEKYIKVGQSTSYFKRFNVVYNYLVNNKIVSDPYSNYTHQYMTNIMAPSSEANTTYKSYYDSNLLTLDFTFLIPVYENMPTSTDLPTKGGWPNNYLKEIKIDDKNITDFDSDTLEYNYYLDINNESIKIDATSISNKASISGTGTFEVKENTTKNIVVTAENGDIRTYKINIILTGTKRVEAIDLATTLNSTDIKNNDKYLSGFIVGSDISVINQKIKNVNESATIVTKKYNNESKNSGVLSTGDKVIITVGDETKEYEAVIYGDSNGDGSIDALDYVKIRKYIMKSTNLSNSFKEASDVNKDGNVDALDYVKIRKYIMNTTDIVQ